MLAVASHVHTRAELEAHQPWLVVDRVPAVEELSGLLFPRPPG